MGGANTDFTVRGPRLPGRNGEVEGSEFLEAPGGKGLNQAVAAARLGARAGVVACIGADRRAREILHALAREGVYARHIVQALVAITGATVIQVDRTGHKQTMHAAGANLCLDVRAIRRAAPALHGAGVLVVQLEPPLPAIVEAVRIAKTAGVPVVLDAGPPRRLPRELLRGLAVVRANAQEAELLTGVHVTDRPTARRAGKVLLGLRVGAAVVEAGARGDLIVWRDGERWLPHIEVPAVDATGAGDAFTAALAVQLVEGRGPAEAGPFARVAAALTTTRLGAWPALPRRDEVLAVLERLGGGPGGGVAPGRLRLGRGAA